MGLGLDSIPRIKIEALYIYSLISTVWRNYILESQLIKKEEEESKR